MARRSKKRFQKTRTVFRKAKRGGRRAARGIGGIGRGLRAVWQPRGAAVLFGVDKLKSMVGLKLGVPQIDDDIDMIIAGLVDRKSSYFVPAGGAKLLKDIADGFLGGQTANIPFLGQLGGGGGGFAGD